MILTWYCFINEAWLFTCKLHICLFSDFVVLFGHARVAMIEKSPHLFNSLKLRPLQIYWMILTRRARQEVRLFIWSVTYFPARQKRPITSFPVSFESLGRASLAWRYIRSSSILFGIRDNHILSLAFYLFFFFEKLTNNKFKRQESNGLIWWRRPISPHQQQKINPNRMAPRGRAGAQGR